MTWVLRKDGFNPPPGEARPEPPPRAPPPISTPEVESLRMVLEQVDVQLRTMLVWEGYNWGEPDHIQHAVEGVGQRLAELESRVRSDNSELENLKAELHAIEMLCGCGDENDALGAVQLTIADRDHLTSALRNIATSGYLDHSTSAKDAIKVNDELVDMARGASRQSND